MADAVHVAGDVYSTDTKLSACVRAIAIISNYSFTTLIFLAYKALTTCTACRMF